MNFKWIEENDPIADNPMQSIQIQLPKPQIIDFCRRWKVRELSLFGSVVRADFRPGSDVDVLISFQPDGNWDLWDLVTMRDELAQMFSRKVDLVEEEAIRNPFRRDSILRDKTVIYAAPCAFTCFSA
jgi:uncharacterized protein